MAKKRGVQARIYVEQQLDRALEGSRFVVSQFRAGLLQRRLQAAAARASSGMSKSAALL